MTPDREALDRLLIRWHRWSADPAQSQDSMARDLDRVIGELLPCIRVALVMEARNLACGAAVWSSGRFGGRKMHGRARSALMRLLRDDQARWFGRPVALFSERGNRIGESHPAAAVRDHDVELCRQLRDQTDEAGRPVWTLGQLAQRFKVRKATVQGWCDGRRRAQVAVKIREMA